MNYWRILERADQALAGDDFVTAEQLLVEARLTRDESGGRVFWTERLADGMRRLLHGIADRGDRTPPAGRWPAAVAGLQTRYRERADATVREAVRLADLRPEDAAEANQPVLESALFLVTRSTLFGEEPSSAVVLLKGVLRTSRRTGRLCDVSLLRHDLPLTEEDRLWLARRGYSLLTEMAADPWVETDGDPADERRQWAAALVRLLHESYFGSVSRLQEERAWFEVVITDHLLDDAPRAVELYRAYMALNPEPGDRSDEARVRTLELLVNATGQHHPVPLYGEAQQSLRSAALAPGSALTTRLAAVLGLIELRRPAAQPSLAWASAAGTPGHLVFITWWGDQPRDVALWAPGAPTDALATFLAPCAGRVVWADPAMAAALPDDQAWATGWPVEPFVVALLEPNLPPEGPSAEVRRRFALGEAGAWRADWNRLHGHPLLEPPRRADRLDAERNDGVSEAVGAGLLWLACLSRIHRADPALRAGCGELARRGDAAAEFVYSCLVLGDDTRRAVDASFQPWTLPLLWTRPDPLTDVGGEAADWPRLDRPDLVGSPVAVVTTGNPAAAAVAWAGGQRRVRVVVDRLERLDAVAPLTSSAYGPVTLVPPAGQVHDLSTALGLLEELLTREIADDADDRLLALFHWVRLVESHNGDLLDFLAVRPRPGHAVGLYTRYSELVSDLPKVLPLQTDDTGEVSWAEQYSQRVRRSGLVVGQIDSLVPVVGRLDDTWGVYDGSDAAWLFLDSAALHWQLLSRGEKQLQRLHTVLATRGRRHLSVLTAAVFARTELEEQLTRWLVPYGAPYRLVLDDVAAPRLFLAAAGVAPDARLLPTACGAGQLARLAVVGAAGRSCLVRLPAEGVWRDFWDDALAGAFGTLPGRPRAVPEKPAGEYLLVPELVAFAGAMKPWSRDWQRADRTRRTRAEQVRAVCSLEINALLACGAETVDIADPRWWRIMRPRRGSDQTDAVWTAGRAVAAATDGRAEQYDLTLPAAAASRRGYRAPVGAAQYWFEPVQRWLQARGLVDERGLGKFAEQSVANAVARATAIPAAAERIELCRGDATRRWWDLAVAAVVAWERGELEYYTLAIATDPPPGVATLLAGVAVPGDTVWSSHPDAEVLSAPGPILWLQPGDFVRPSVKAALQLYPPRAIWVGDLASWLPTVDHPHTSAAIALRWIATAGAERCVILLDDLSQPWVRYLAGQLGTAVPEANGGGPGDGTAAVVTTGAALALAAPVPIGRADSWQVTCPRCGSAADGNAAAVSCPHCCLPVVDWLGPAARLQLARRLDTARFDALLRRDDCGQPLPLRLWTTPGSEQNLVDDIDRQRFAGEISARPQQRQWSLSVGRKGRWVLASRENLHSFDPQWHHALLFAPSPQLAGLPPWPDDAQGTLSLCYHPVELDGGRPERTLVRRRRLWHLLRDFPQVWPRRPGADEPEMDLVPLLYLTFVCGIEAAELMQGVNTARWLALLAGDPVTAVADPPQTGAAEVLAAGLTYAEIESNGRQLMDLLPALLAGPLADAAPGQIVRCDLTEMIGHCDRDVLWSLDRLLGAWSLQLPAGAVAVPGVAAPGSGEQLIYRPEMGSLFSHRRLIGYLGEPELLLAALHRRMDHTLATVRRLWAESGRDGEGVRLVLTPELDLPDRLPALGAMLHWWRWEGPCGDGALPLIDLLTLADSAALHSDTAASDLWQELVGRRDRWYDTLRRAWQDGVLDSPLATTAGPAAPRRRRRFGLLQPGRQAPHELAAVRVGEFTAPGGDGSNLLVLRGMTGSGRLAAVVDGIGRALGQGVAPEEITYYCPDTATAARLHVALRRLRCDLSPDIVISGERSLPPPLPADADLRRGETVVVALEAQRFATEERYRVCERARPGRLVMTIDMAETAEPWENMFLTTPGRGEVVVLDRQIRQARRLWAEVCSLLPAATAAHERAGRRDKGLVTTCWAANLDECVACLLAEYAAGRLSVPVALSAPLAEDCTYLGRSLAARDWLPVFRSELDELLLPGMLEFLAATTDVWATAGQLRAAAADGAAQPVPITEYQAGSYDSLLAPLLDDARRDSYRCWLAAAHNGSAETTLARLYELMAGAEWAAPILAAPAARSRVEGLLARLGDESVAALVRRPLWEAWWYEVLALNGQAGPAERRPVVTLSSADRGGGRLAADGVYLCLGTEPARVHYRVLGRITDRSLVLYQERSPLPSSGDGQDGAPSGS